MKIRQFGVYLVMIALLFCHEAEAVPGKDLFQRYQHPVFIESGTFLGDGVLMALEAGFQKIYSVEISHNLHQRCCQRFQGDPRVHLYLGDSTEIFKEILLGLHERATFWLDGHYSEGITEKGKTNTPILQELALIASHPIKNHTILIDDVRQFGTADFDYISLGQIVDAIKQINPDYIIRFENGYIPNDILVAEIP